MSDYVTYSQTIDASGAGDHLAFVGEHLPGGNAEVKRVIFEQETNADVSFNVDVDGSALYAGALSPSSADTPETAVPDNGNENVTGDTPRLETRVTSAAAAADDLNVTVVVEVKRAD